MNRPVSLHSHVRSRRNNRTTRTALSQSVPLSLRVLMKNMSSNPGKEVLRVRQRMEHVQHNRSSQRVRSTQPTGPPDV